MSGIEVAGLVLGAFPIAVWALERYRDVARRMGFWYEIRLEYQRSSSELKFHRLSFLRNLKQLLLPLVADDAQLQLLIVDPGGPAWKDPIIEQALETRLQDSYGLYLEILGEMERVMQELNDELAVEDSGVRARVKEQKTHSTGNPNPNVMSMIRQPFEKTNRSYQVFRLKFSNGKRTRTRLFGELQTFNDRLEKLTATSDIVSKLQAGMHEAKSTSSPSVNAALCKFWSHADKLYRVLLGAWNCSCREQHCAQLILQHRKTPKKTFQLNLSSTSHQCVEPSSWPTRSVQVAVMDKPQVKVAVTVVAEPDPKTPIQVSNPQHRTKRPGKPALASSLAGRKASRPPNANIRLGGSSTTRTSTTVTVREEIPAPSVGIPGLTRADAQEQRQSDVVPIKSLCGSLVDNAKLPSCIGYMEDDDVRYYIYSEPDAAPLPLARPVNLGQILAGDVKPALTRRQRYHLSLTLASSFVQLKGSPWLQSPWGKGCVYFAPAVAPCPSPPTGSNNSASNSHTPLRLDAPFIIGMFGQPPPQPKQQPPAGGNDVADIASLGIVLLELCFGQPVERLPSRTRFPAGDEHAGPAFDLIAALEWLKEVHDEAGADYSDAVTWCLAGCRTLPSEDGSWRPLMLEKVVRPLERCSQYLW